MGEFSKSVGEYGEGTVEQFLKLIGWGEVAKGISVDCLKPVDHKLKSERTTHGIDFYYSYLSPLVDSTLKNVHISSKFTASLYPNAPNNKFKAFVEDLAQAIDCFQYSSQKSEFSSAIKGYSHKEDVGVIFWLSNAGPQQDVIEKISGSYITIEGTAHSIYVIDNNRISFIFQAIYYSKAEYTNHHIDFFYPSTGKNINPTTKRSYGKELPVEYINSSILPIRVEDKSSQATELLLFTIDPFAIEDLMQLIGLAKELSNSWSMFITIAFPDFNELNNGQDVRKAKMQFEDKSLMENLKVVSYNPSFTK